MPVCVFSFLSLSLSCSVLSFVVVLAECPINTKATLTNTSPFTHPRGPLLSGLNQLLVELWAAWGHFYHPHCLCPAWHPPASSGQAASPPGTRPASFTQPGGAPSLATGAANLQSDLPTSVRRHQKPGRGQSHTGEKTRSTPLSKAALRACPGAPGRDPWTSPGSHLSLGMAARSTFPPGLEPTASASSACPEKSHGLRPSPCGHWQW